jgi:predicted DNA-binding transcriptional regulator
LRELYKDLDVAADINMKGLEWVGYVVSMDQGREVIKALESKLVGSRRRERPRLRWLEDVE